MSRSYKKVPGKHGESRNHLRYSKRQSNKKVRKSEDISDGGAYKRIYETWNIRDYICLYYSKRELDEYWGDKAYKMKTK